MQKQGWTSYGRVLAVGPGKEALEVVGRTTISRDELGISRTPIAVKVGEHIIINGKGNPVKWEGKEYHLIPEKDVLGVLPD
jgi:co-chaperonin GroES (HSP10)